MGSALAAVLALAGAVFPWPVPIAASSVAQVRSGQGDAVSREVAVFNDLPTQLAGDSVSREVALFNDLPTQLAGDSVSREVALFNEVPTGLANDSVSREVAVSSPPVLPTSFQVFRGIRDAGTLASLFELDNDLMDIRRGITANPTEAPITLILTGASPLANPTALEFSVAARVNTVGLQVTLDLFDWVANRYDPTDVTVRNGSTTFSRVFVTATNPARYVRSGTREIRARYRVRQTGPTTTQTWRSLFDQAVWWVEGSN